MPKLIKMLVLLQIVCNMWFIVETNAAIIQADSCSKIDVETAIAAASDGDTVVIPDGTCSWSSRVEIDRVITVQGQTTTSRNGTTYEVIPSDGTLIQTSGFDITETDPGVRVTGITFDQMASTQAFKFPSGMTSLRIDHCHFNRGERIFNVKGTPPMGILFDNNRIVNPTGESFYINGAGNDAWAAGGAGVGAGCANWALSCCARVS